MTARHSIAPETVVALLPIFRDELAVRIGAPNPTSIGGSFASWSPLTDTIRRNVCVDLVATADGAELRLMSAATGAPLAPPMLVLDEPLPRGGPTASEEAEVVARLPVGKRVEVPLRVAIEVVIEVARLAEEEREASARRRLGPVQVLSSEAEELLRRHGIDPAAALVSIQAHAARGAHVMKFAVPPSRIEAHLFDEAVRAAGPASVETITLQARPLATHRYGVDRLEWVPVPGTGSQDPPGERGCP